MSAGVRETPDRKCKLSRVIPPVKSVLLIGSGPIVIGQACEFDYSGVQALKALRKNGLRTLLLNPNPATIMTDPGLADRTYLEPLTLEALEKILTAEKPDAVLPTMGGQTGLNLAMAAHRAGLFKKHEVRMIGATPEAIRCAEDRWVFRETMEKAGLSLAHGFTAKTQEELLERVDMLGYPLLLRTSFTLGGLGSGIIRNEEELLDSFRTAQTLAPGHEVLVEEFLEGWYEFELEVMRDRRDNCVVVCSIENVDPMGVHTGDSVTVAPAQTLTDREYQEMRQMAFACIRAVGVDTGGANVQFARHPGSGKLLLIEMNPRVSRSSALASKATGVPIASIAAELALGKTLDQIPNAVTGKTTAAFEPSLDYVVVKIPQFQFSKFEVRDPWLGTSMKSIGEAMAIGRTFPEALQKGVRSMEEGFAGLAHKHRRPTARKEMFERLERGNPYRLFYVKEALDHGMKPDAVCQQTGIHPWFVDQIQRLVVWEARRAVLNAGWVLEGKGLGYSDAHLAKLLKKKPSQIEALRRKAKIEPAFLEVDTCAGEFEARTPYYYSSYARSPGKRRPVQSKKKRFVVMGSGPNRIGEGLEFDYSCVKASEAIQEAGHDAVLINSNPETVSTDYDVSSRLYFDPVDLEEVDAVLRREDPDGVIVQFGGQQPLILAGRLAKRGWPIVGTPVAEIHRTEDRISFAESLRALDIPYPKFREAPRLSAVMHVAEEVGYPVLVRPSYVMGGDRIRIFKHAEALERYLAKWPDDNVSFLVDRFLSQAVEVDVDAVSDGKDIEICGMLEHIEPAGIHSGDSSMIFPPFNFNDAMVERIAGYVRRIAAEFKVKGICNLQLAIYKGTPYVIELNARASRTVPFLSKATGVPWAKVATRILLGESLKTAIGHYKRRKDKKKLYYAKASAFCFYRFEGPPPPLGPEMRSTGETMGIAATPEEALSKARLAAGQEPLGRFGRVYCLQDL